MTWDEGLDGIHRDIAASDARRIAVLAGPGTGKTSYGLMRRVARLVEQGADAKSILLLSFTRNAARDLSEKVAALGLSDADHILATTLHAYCMSILMRDDVLPVIGRTPRILLEHERDLMLRDIDGPWGDLKAKRKLLKAFEAGWARGEQDHPGLAKLPDDRAFEQQVMAWMIHNRAMLVGEVVPLAYNYLKAEPLNPERRRFEYIIVDEYQDLNTLEQRFIELLAGEQGSICVAGDDDQSIYGFRFANPEGILNFRDQPGVQSFELDVCGRCPSNIIDMANSLIEQAPGRNKAPLVARRQEPGDVAIVQWETLEDEGDGIAAAIATDIQAERFDPSQILVLTNLQEVGQRIRHKLISNGVDAHSFFTEELLKKSPEAQRGLAVLRLLVGDDPVSLRVILGSGDDQGRAGAYRRLRARAASLGMSERDLLDNAVRKHMKIGIQVPSLTRQYEQLLAELTKAPVDDLEALVDFVFPLNTVSVNEIWQIASELRVGAESLEELVKRLVTRITQFDIPESPNYVRIMSLHKSKGLTAGCVYIVGALQGSIPYLSTKNTEAEDAAAIEEQRRLMYVAVTRATEQLVISFPQEVEVGKARSWGLKEAGRPRRSRNGGTVCKVLASTYLREFGQAAPAVVPGAEWLSEYPPEEAGAEADVA